MRYQLICTSYNDTEQGLVLRNSWIEPSLDDENLSMTLSNWNIDLNSIDYPYKNSISKLLIGTMGIDNVSIHIRIVRF